MRIPVFFIRYELGLSQTAFAKRVGCSRRAVQAWEAGTAQPRQIYVQRMAAMQKRLLSRKA